MSDCGQGQLQGQVKVKAKENVHIVQRVWWRTTKTLGQLSISWMMEIEFHGKIAVAKHMNQAGPVVESFKNSLQ